MDVHPDKKLKQAIDNRVTALQEKQQAQAEQEKVKVQKETEKLQAEADAQIELTKAEADAKKTKVKAAAEAENTKIKAKAQAEANNELSASITDELIKMKEAEAHYKNGWVPVELAEVLNYTDADACKKSMETVKKAFQTAVEKAVDEKLNNSRWKSADRGKRDPSADRDGCRWPDRIRSNGILYCRETKESGQSDHIYGLRPYDEHRAGIFHGWHNHKYSGSTEEDCGYHRRSCSDIRINCDIHESAERI